MSDEAFRADNQARHCIACRRWVKTRDAICVWSSPTRNQHGEHSRGRWMCLSPCYEERNVWKASAHET